MNQGLKRGVWTGVIVGVLCMFLADLITMIPAVQAVTGMPIAVTKWAIFAVLVLIVSFVLSKTITK